MRSESLIYALVLVLLTGPAGAAQLQIREVTWAGLRQEVAQRHLTGRWATISLSDGGKVSATLRRVEEDSLVVASHRTTQERWPATGGEARIPRAEVTSVQFSGKQGRGGLIGGLVGLGVGGAVSMGAASGQEGNAVGAGILAMTGGMALAGYLIGRRSDKPIPVFRIVPETAPAEARNSF